jgi:hypothetical protein
MPQSEGLRRGCALYWSAGRRTGLGALVESVSREGADGLAETGRGGRESATTTAGTGPGGQ